MKINKSFYQFKSNKSNGKPRNPLKTYLELSEYLCKKYNVSDTYLRTSLRRNDAPKMFRRFKSSDGKQNSWYDPVEFISWFKRVMIDDVPKA